MQQFTTEKLPCRRKMLKVIKEYFAMQKASKWFDKNPAAQARFEDLEDWLEEVEERLEEIEKHIGIEDDE